MRFPSLLALFTGLLAAGQVASLGAQVGVPPAESPFTSIRPGTMFELHGGVIAGNGGPLHAGPRDGQMLSFRILLRANSTLSLGFGLWGATAKRTVIDPTRAPEQQERGDIDQELYGAEATFQLNLTGGKTWRGLAPYVGSGLGAVKSGTINDQHGYDFGTKFYFAPMLGTRAFVGERLALRLEARAFTWKLSYPSSWAIEPPAAPGTLENPNAVNPTGRTGQYVVAPALMFGIGVAF